MPSVMLCCNRWPRLAPSKRGVLSSPKRRNSWAPLSSPALRLAPSWSSVLRTRDACRDRTGVGLLVCRAPDAVGGRIDESCGPSSSLFPCSPFPCSCSLSFLLSRHAVDLMMGVSCSCNPRRLDAPILPAACCIWVEFISAPATESASVVPDNQQQQPASRQRLAPPGWG